MKFKSIFLAASLTLIALQVGNSLSVNAQTLYKYVDADGKVTYSDKAPKPGEKAEAVKTDVQANVVAAPKNTINGVKQTITGINARGKQLEVDRAALQKNADDARAAMEKAKKALDDGQEVLLEEKQIVAKEGGKNTMIIKESYYARIAGLEAAVKAAEANYERAEQQYRRKAP